MLFNSIQFVLFFIITTILYFCIPHRYRWIGLLAASCIFYLSWSRPLFLLLLGVSLISYLSALFLDRFTKCRKLVFICTIIIILGVLFYFKYFNYFANSVSRIAKNVFSTDFQFARDILLPVGISFYTFQAIGYLADVYSGKTSAEKNFFSYFLFLSYFPQLIAGPIERSRDLLPQLRNPLPFSPDGFLSGGKRMLIGFFEKIAVADMLGLIVNRVYEAPSEADGFSVLFATILFSLQILCDFKGYTDIAIGMSEIYGIRLHENFNKPYSATSIRDFWKRWHITLSSWFQDYIYIPLGGNRKGQLITYRNILLVFIISGLWHGAGTTFLLWGLMHAVFWILESILLKCSKKSKAGFSPAFHRILTFLCVTFAWIFFRANSLTDLGILFEKLFTGWDFSALRISVFLQSLQANIPYLIILILSMLAFFLMPLFLRSQKASKYGFLRFLAFAVLIWLTIASFLYLHARGISSSFIYFQF